MTGPDPDFLGPKYRQLAGRIRSGIEEGVYKAGQPIPLSGDSSLEVPKSPSVVKKALRLLEEEGWVTADRRGGWLASIPRKPRGVLLGWDPAETQPTGSRISETRVVSKVAATLPAEFLEHFEIHGVDGKRASKVVKVQIEDGRPALLETILAPTSRLPGLVMKDHRQDNIYEIIQSGYKIPISSISQSARLRLTTEEEAMALQIDRKPKVLALDRIVFGGGSGVAVIRLVYPDPERGISDYAHARLAPSTISR